MPTFGTMGRRANFLDPSIERRQASIFYLELGMGWHLVVGSRVVGDTVEVAGGS